MHTNSANVDIGRWPGCSIAGVVGGKGAKGFLITEIMNYIMQV